MPFRRDVVAREMKRQGWSQRRFAGAVGVSQPTVSDWLSGEKEPKSRYVPKMAEVLGLSVNDLLSETAGISGNTPDNWKQPGEMYEADFGPWGHRKGDEVSGPYRVGKMVSLPVISEVHAGDPRAAISEAEEWVPIEEELIQGGEYFWVRVQGESMTGVGIMPGSLILVRRQCEVGESDIAVVDIAGEGAAIKRVLPANGDVYLMSENANFPPRKMAAEDVRIVGKVESLYRRF